jgi:hypothetical protein
VTTSAAVTTAEDAAATRVNERNVPLPLLSTLD